MAGIDTIRDQIEAARARRSGYADGQRAVSRSEAIAIIKRAAAAKIAADDIRQAFREAGDNGFGSPMARYLEEFEVIRVIGTEPPLRAPLPKAAVLSVRRQQYSSIYGQHEVAPLTGAGSDGGVRVRLTSANPFEYSSGPGETPLIYGRDGLFDQTALRLYGFAPADPLSADDQARARTLARDPDLAYARYTFIEAGPTSIEVTLPQHPKVD